MQFNEYIYLFRSAFDTEIPFFIALHGFMTISLYFWIICFSLVYLPLGSDPQRFSLISVLAPLLTIVIFLVVINILMLVITTLDLRLVSWPLWFACLVFSFAILCSNHLIALLAYWFEKRSKAYRAMLVIGILLSLALLVYINLFPAFERYVMMRYFDYPDFIR